MVDLGLDVASDPGWWGADDSLPDGISEDEAWALIRRSGAPPHRAVALIGGCAAMATEMTPELTLAPEMPAAPTEEPSSIMPPDGPLPAESPLLLTIKEAAERLGVGRCMVQQLVLDGSIRSFKVGTKLRRIPPEALDEYIQRSLGHDA
jgi:excisionase family DNA binding protein